MKTLIIIRHAKSSWDNMALSDFDRPLNGRGKRDAPAMGDFMKKMGVIPELMISSPAKRAKTTAFEIAGKLGIKKDDIVLDENMYHATTSEILHVISGVDDSIGVLVIVGHNPGLTYLANTKTGAYIDNIPTTGIVGINFDVDSWQDVEDVQGIMAFFEYPKKSL